MEKEDDQVDRHVNERAEKLVIVAPVEVGWDQRSLESVFPAVITGRAGFWEMVLTCG